MTGTPKGRNATKAAASAKRAPYDQLEPAGLSKNPSTTRARLTPVMRARSCSLDRQVADPEGDDQDVEHEHDRVQLSDEQPAVDTEPIGGEGADAEPGQPQ